MIFVNPARGAVPGRGVLPPGGLSGGSMNKSRFVVAAAIVVAAVQVYVALSAGKTAGMAIEARAAAILAAEEGGK